MCSLAFPAAPGRAACAERRGRTPQVSKRMATCGVETVIVDLKAEMAEGCFDVVRCQARYDGGYWNTTGIGRIVTCHGLVTAMQKRGVQVLSHGATGRGNDQMRFERYTNVPRAVDARRRT